MKIRLTALLALLCILLSSCTVLPYFPEFSYDPTTHSSGYGSELPEGGLTVRFLDVGQADCALLECSGEYMLIDGGNVPDGQLVVSTLTNLGVQQLSAVVCSHAHEDHVGGLPAVLAVFPTQLILAPTRTYSSACFDDFMYYADQQGLTVTIPSPGDSFSLGGATVTVLGPVASYAETNNTSIILHVSYGESDFIFTGDMETDAETELLDHWGESTFPEAEVLKVGHHGSDTSTSYRFLYSVAPDYAVVSVGEDNSYGHPSETVLSRLLQAGCTVLRTDLLGAVTAYTDGQAITFTWENQDADPMGAEKAEAGFIGNQNSHVLHLPTCSGLPSAENRVYFENYTEAIDAGYNPCSRCMK